MTISSIFRDQRRRLPQSIQCGLYSNTAYNERFPRSWPPESKLHANDRPIDERIHAALASALLQGKLAPGAQLVERDLAAAFDCTRGTIRKVLTRLGFEGKVVLEANRGAFVPSPSVDDIRAVYRARQLVEAGIVVTLCGALTAQQKRRLRAHVKSEEKGAGTRAMSRPACGLQASFICCWWRFAGAPELLGVLAQLVAKTELYKALFDPVEGVELRVGRTRGG